MAYEELLREITLEADSSIAVYTGPPGVTGSANPNGGHQYKFVKVTGARTAGLAVAAANERVIGVLQNKPQNTGEAATVAVDGVSKVLAGGAITAGSGVKVNASGLAVAWVAGTDDEGLCTGIALTAGVSGELMSVLLRRN
jgi:hypothetical protein